MSTARSIPQPPVAVNDDRATTAAAVARYLHRIPRETPAGELVVHNRVRPCLDPWCRARGIETMADVTVLGLNGFRAWRWPEGDERAVPCDCGWAPHLPVHYRVKGAGGAEGVTT